MIGVETVPLPLLPRQPTLEDLPIRPVVRRWARATVRELAQLVRPLPRTGRRRLLALFIDGLGADLLARATADGTMPFLARLRDSRTMREARTFSGMPSTTTAFQAGLFYGLRHPDVPAFDWLDRSTHRPLHMNRPGDAAQVEDRIRRIAGAGLMAGGSAYLSILRGGSPDFLSTSGAAALLQLRELPHLPQAEWPAMLRIHEQTALTLAARLATETVPFLWNTARFIRAVGTRRFEGNFVLNHFLVGTLVKEVAQGQAILDLVRGVPRIFINFHDFDEAAHRRGPALAGEKALRGIDRSVEALCAIAAAVDDPPDVYVFSDHGQIPSTPFEKRFGCTFSDWVRGAGDGPGPRPRLPRDAIEAAGNPPIRERFAADLQVLECGNYAHVYLERGGPLDLRAIVERHPTILARILSCSGVGLAIVRRGTDAVAFAGGRRVDPADPEELPSVVSADALRAALEDFARSPSAGDILVYGNWEDGGATALSWEWSSHGGPSRRETETFLLHPVGVPFEPSQIRHAADLHAVFRALYGGSES